MAVTIAYFAILYTGHFFQSATAQHHFVSDGNTHWTVTVSRSKY